MCRCHLWVLENKHGHHQWYSSDLYSKASHQAWNGQGPADVCCWYTASEQVLVCKDVARRRESVHQEQRRVSFVWHRLGLPVFSGWSGRKIKIQICCSNVTRLWSIVLMITWRSYLLMFCNKLMQTVCFNRAGRWHQHQEGKDHSANRKPSDDANRVVHGSGMMVEILVLWQRVTTVTRLNR